MSFADVNVSEAKLLLIRAQDSVQGALAELGRAMGSDQPANYQLADEPLPPAPPATPDPSGFPGDRQPARTCQRCAASRDAASRFFDAEKDLVASHRQRGCRGWLHSLHQYSRHGAHSSRIRRRRRPTSVIPVFNGHLFSARREAAYQRALESDQRLRDEQERISRDVRVAWASANDAYQRIDVTAQFLAPGLAGAATGARTVRS